MELEQAAEVRRLAAALAARQTPDFEAWESLLLQAARQGGAGVLGTLLSHGQQHAPREVILCPCGQRMRSRGRRSKGLLTTLGRVPFARSFYQCPPCSQGRFPDDERLDIVPTTSALGTSVPTAASEATFYIRFDGTGVPVRKSELVGRRGKQADGSARTREAKRGCVFTQVGLDQEGYPQRDPHSTT